MTQRRWSEKFTNRWLLTAFVALAIAPIQAATPDMARLFSDDAILFAHCDGWIAADGPTAKLARQVAARLAKETRFDGERLGGAADLLIDLAPAHTGFAFWNIRDSNGHTVADAAFAFQGVSDPDSVLTRFRALIDDDEAFSQADLGGATLTRWQPDEHSDLWLGVVGKTLIFATSPVAAEKLVRGISTGSGTLAGNPDFQRPQQAAQRNTATETCGFFVDVPALTAIIERLIRADRGELPPQWETVLKETGMRDIRSVYWSHGKIDDMKQGTVFVRTTPNANSGILNLYRQAKFDESALMIVPADAYWTKASSLDFHSIWREVLRVINEIDPTIGPKIDGGLAMTQQMVGFSLTDDFLRMLGNEWVMYDAPAHGGIYMLGTTLSVKPKSTTDMATMVSRFVEIASPLAQQGEIDVKEKQLNFGGHEITYVLVGNQPVALSLSWVPANGRMLLGLSPHAVASALPRFAEPSREGSLLTAEDYQSLRQTFPDEISGLAYFNSKQTRWMVYPLLQLAQTAAVSYAASEGAEIDFAVVPPYPAFAEDRHNLLGASWHEEDGLFFSYAGNMNFVSPGGAAIAIISGSILLPSLSRARYLARRAVSMANARGIAQCFFLYANDHEQKFPASLQDLVDSNCVTPRGLLSPYGKEGEVSYVMIPAPDTSTDPRNMIVYEKLDFGGEGTVTAYADGHAEFLQTAEFERRYHETYERLGIEAPPIQYRE